MENGKMGPFIRRLRRERGMTQRELAAALGVTDKAVSKWELGASLPDVALLLPLLTLRRGPVPGALAALSAAILPYLYILGDLLGEPRVFRLGLPIAPLAALYLWGVYAVCRKHRRRRWHAAGDILLLTAALNFAVDIAVYLAAPNALLRGGPLAALTLSAACFLTDYVLRRLREAPEA